MSYFQAINPETGRKIKIDGPTYKKLINRGYHDSDLLITTALKKMPKPSTYREFIETRNIEPEFDDTTDKLKRWQDLKPQTNKEREDLYFACGNKCFLRPANLAFPICRKCKDSKCSCKLDCSGVLSAKVRAIHWGYPEVTEAAIELEDEIC